MGKTMKKEFFTPKDKHGNSMEPVEIIGKFSQFGATTIFNFVIHKENNGLDVIVSEKQTGAKVCRIAGFYGCTIDARYYTKKEIIDRAKLELLYLITKHGAQKFESVILSAIEKQKNQVKN